ncbi:Uncharacterised protein [Vibrio cholerae]|uniref:Uncharacterized protein n=1 Tax=Vibrio cholerae TaxID=666 RepID=A0A655QB47_VIBCL|nr:Uncharacterised protein [Vibrio cholerae]CSA66908.1 Uncharacterised protein [Vibrio cholerae]CSC24928.1 Uncharacterised protein [Vibrio cholerae]
MQAIIAIQIDFWVVFPLLSFNETAGLLFFGIEQA